MQNIADEVVLRIIAPYLDVSSFDQLGHTSKHWSIIHKTYIVSVFPRLEFDLEWVKQHHDPMSWQWYWNLRVSKFPQHRCSKATATSVFRLTAKQCDALPGTLVRNPQFRSSAPMKLLELQDVFRECLNRHGSIGGLYAYKAILDQRKQKRVVSKVVRKLDLKHQLLQALAGQGLPGEPRRDSNLIRMWLEDNATAVKEGWTLEKVVRRYCEVRFLFNYCPEFKRINAELEDRHDADRAELEDNWSDSESHQSYHMEWDGFNAFEMAEAMCQVVYPSKWPWL